jgi:type I restriction enzyme S subunit
MEMDAIRHKSGKEYQPFLKGLIDDLLPELLNITSGSVFPNITGKDLLEHRIAIPPLCEQNTISSTLEALDNKIDLLRCQNKTLEQLAETLFRQWFVEEASEDWEVKSLVDVADFFNGKPRPKETGTIPIYGGNGILGHTDRFNYFGRSIIIGRVGAYCGSLYYENKETWVSDNALLVKAKNEKHTHYLFYLLKTSELNSMAEGSSHPLLIQTLLKSIQLDLPPNYKLESFYFYIEEWRDKIQRNISQIVTLTHLRDALLPKLMSGEVRVKM